MLRHSCVFKQVVRHKQQNPFKYVWVAANKQQQQQVSSKSFSTSMLSRQQPKNDVDDSFLPEDGDTNNVLPDMDEFDPTLLLAPEASSLDFRPVSLANEMDEFDVENLFSHLQIASAEVPSTFSNEHTQLHSQQQQQARTNDSLESIRKMHETSDAIIRQQELERRGIENAIQRYRKAVINANDRKQGASLPPAQNILFEWFQPLVHTLKEKQQQYHSVTEQAKLDDDLRAVGPYITLLDAEKLAIIAFHEMMSSCLMVDKAKVVDVAFNIGNDVYAEINLQKLKKLPSLKYALKQQSMSKQSVYSINKMAASYFETDEWGQEVRVRIGAYLIGILIDVATIPTLANDKVEQTKAFTHELEIKDKKRIGVVTMHDELRRIVQEGHDLREIYDAKHLPMIIKPTPWSEFNEGGYLTVKNAVMRTKGSFFQTYVLRDSYLDEFFDGLNVLNDTKWRVNQRVYQVIKKVWDDGGGIADLPSRTDDIVPDKPELDDVEVLKKWRKKVSKIRQHNRDLHSLRCDTTYKLQVAEEFFDKSFYFPHNIDFRGRAYPIPPHLNHLGADFNRGVLCFERHEPISKKGIFWLKIHLANLCGKDKFNFEERVKFVDENLEQIFDSSDNPLDGKRWWLQSENPWQSLAACFELTDCLRSPDPEQFRSSLPLQMDGSCNGLQHYAALGRDNLGALHVNLLPTEKPMDVYNGVLAVVLKNIEADARAGDVHAKALVGKVYRSTIKQTVMTSVYGVTFVGAREQIERRLKEKKEVDEELIYMCAAYLAKTTLKSLGEVFRGAKGIMDWLNECAYLIATKNHPVMWVTPLGLPVVQPYRSPRKVQIKTVLQKVLLVDNKEKMPISRERQVSAFPPNYVHSLDASHMFMTAKACKAQGIEFASVHDSYWTHASTVDAMNHLIRQQFISLHSQPLLETLLSTFKFQHPDIAFPPLPKPGALNLERVLRAPYFFD